MRKRTGGGGSTQQRPLTSASRYPSKLPQSNNTFTFTDIQKKNSRFLMYKLGIGVEEGWLSRNPWPSKLLHPLLLPSLDSLGHSPRTLPVSSCLEPPYALADTMDSQSPSLAWVLFMNTSCPEFGRQQLHWSFNWWRSVRERFDIHTDLEGVRYPQASLWVRLYSCLGYLCVTDLVRRQNRQSAMDRTSFSSSSSSSFPPSMEIVNIQ